MAITDPETQKMILDGQEVSNMLESKGWGFIKSKLDERILDLQNINNLDIEKPETLSTQLMARKMAADFIFAWLKHDVYGFVEQQAANSAALTDRQDTGFIDR